MTASYSAKKLSLCIAMLCSAGYQPQLYADQSDKAKQNKEATSIEEVLVRGRQLRTDASEINPETERLFSVAGAANDPLQSIFALPGVTFAEGDGPGGNEPVIRGSAPQDNAYFIDLVPARYIFHLFGNSIFDKNLIHDFNLYAAAFSSEYGNATGGIIDVSLREPRNQEFTSIGHFSFLSTGVLVESGLGNDQAFYASYRRSLIDQFTDEDDIGDDEPGFQIDRLPVSDDYQVKYRWHINDNHRLAFIAAGASDVVGATFGEGNNEVERDPDFAGPAALDLGFDSQGIVWDWFQDDRELSVIATHIADKEQFTYGANQFELTESDSYLGRIIYQQKRGSKHLVRFGASVEDITYDINFNAKIVACNDLDPECSTVDADIVVYQDQLVIKQYQAFAEDLWQLNNKHSVTFGLHYSDDDYLQEGRLEPRLRWDYVHNSDLSVFAAAGQYSQLPQLREIIDVLGNPELTTIKSDHYVVGFEYALSKGWGWQSDIYYKNLSDIVVSTQADATANNFSNNVTGKAYGIEFLVDKALTDRWYGWMSLSLSKTERTNTVTDQTLKFEYDKPVLFNLVANRLLGKHWMLGIKWTYQSGGRYTPIVALEESTSQPDIFEPVYGELNSETLPAYHRLDFRAEYTKPTSWGHWKFFVDILNVYNRENIEEYDYAPNGRDLVSPPAGFGADIPVQAETSEGLIPSIGFEIKF